MLVLIDIYVETQGLDNMDGLKLVMNDMSLINQFM